MGSQRISEQPRCPLSRHRLSLDWMKWRLLTILTTGGANWWTKCAWATTDWRPKRYDYRCSCTCDQRTLRLTMLRKISDTNLCSGHESALHFGHAAERGPDRDRRTDAKTQSNSILSTSSSKQLILKFSAAESKKRVVLVPLLCDSQLHVGDHPFLKTVDFEVFSSRKQEKSGFEKRL